MGFGRRREFFELEIVVYGKLSSWSFFKILLCRVVSMDVVFNEDVL